MTDPASTRADIIHHDLKVTLEPGQAGIAVIDNVHLPANASSAEFLLRNGLTVEARGTALEMLGYSTDSRLRLYRLNRLSPDGKVQLVYHGNIASGRTKGIFNMPESVLDQELAYLDGGSARVPRFQACPRFAFSLDVEAPADWEMVSQGLRRRIGSRYLFDTPQPQDDVYLPGGAYKWFAIEHSGIETVVYLPGDDADLADKYLNTSAEYPDRYGDWIGPYPKFAIVENRRQTGYGMPSFTLLASRHSVVMLDPDNERTALGFIGADDPQAIASMARKLPHYSSYGALGFTRAGAENLRKLRLPVLMSPMAKQLTG